MDFWKALHELNAERQRLEKVIATLEALDAAGKKDAKSRRGRKGMPEHERRIVSERMKQYWASRRRQKAD
jgi:hypothetical protein